MLRTFKPRLSKTDSPVPDIFQKMDTPPSTPTKPKHRVSFDATIRAILIPSREEYQEANLSPKLWYNKREISKMEKTALVKISTGNLFLSDSTDEIIFFPRSKSL
jgi:hypothetical protein